MADLSTGGFQRVISGTGSLVLSHAASTAHELHAWLLLVDPSGLEPLDLHPEALLRELIRVPLEPAAGGTTLYVPVGRPMGVLLMARDANGQMAEPPAFEVREGGPVARSRYRPAGEPDVTRDGVAPARAEGPAATGPRESLAPTGPREAPAEAMIARAGPIRTSRQGREIPLVFAQAGQGPLPDLSSLAQRVATRAGAVAPELRPSGAVGPELRPSGAVAPELRPSGGTSEPPPTSAPASAEAESQARAARPTAGFGARQRWTLTRFGFETSDLPRALVLRPTFIDEATLASFQAALPADAVPVPIGADGLVDAVSDDDAMMFYALLEGPAPWRPVPLRPLSPPFEESLRPFVLGDAAARLEPYLSQQPRSETHAALLADVARVLETPPKDRP